MESSPLHLFKGPIQDLIPHFYSAPPSQKIVILTAYPQRITLIQESLKKSEGIHFLWKHCLFLTMDQFLHEEGPKDASLFVFDEWSKFDWAEFYERNLFDLFTGSNIFLTGTMGSQDDLKECKSFFQGERSDELRVKVFPTKKEGLVGHYLWNQFLWSYLHYLLDFSRDRMLLVVKMKRDFYRFNYYFQRRELETPGRLTILTEKESPGFETRGVKHVFLLNLLDPDEWKKEFFYYQGQYTQDGPWEIYQDSKLFPEKLPSLKITSKVLIQKGRDFLCAS